MLWVFFLILFKVREGPEVKEQDFALTLEEQQVASATLYSRDRIYIYILCSSNQIASMAPQKKVVSAALGRLRLTLPCTLKARSADSTWVESNIHPAKGRQGRGGGGYFHTDPLIWVIASTCLYLFWIKLPVWWSIFTFNLLMLINRPHKPTPGGRLAWSGLVFFYLTCIMILFY